MSCISACQLSPPRPLPANPRQRPKFRAVPLLFALVLCGCGVSAYEERLNKTIQERRQVLIEEKAQAQQQAAGQPPPQ